MQGLGLEMGSSMQHSKDRGDYSNSGHMSASKSDQTKDSAPKKMTWASIASQPAKPQIRVRFFAVLKKIKLKNICFLVDKF